MPSLIIKNIPETLYNKLKKSASFHDRSIDKELIHCLEQILPPERKNSSEYLERARAIREGINPNLIHVDDIQNAIKEGRS